MEDNSEMGPKKREKRFRLVHVRLRPGVNVSTLFIAFYSFV